jgi:hypothetical protein
LKEHVEQPEEKRKEKIQRKGKKEKEKETNKKQQQNEFSLAKGLFLVENERNFPTERFGRSSRYFKIRQKQLIPSHLALSINLGGIVGGFFSSFSSHGSTESTQYFLPSPSLLFVFWF